MSPPVGRGRRRPGAVVSGALCGVLLLFVLSIYSLLDRRGTAADTAALRVITGAGARPHDVVHAGDAQARSAATVAPTSSERAIGVSETPRATAAPTARPPPVAAPPSPQPSGALELWGTVPPGGNGLAQLESSVARARPIADAQAVLSQGSVENDSPDDPAARAAWDLAAQIVSALGRHTAQGAFLKDTSNLPHLNVVILSGAFNAAR